MLILENGIRILFRRTTTNNIFALSCMFDAGAVYEDPSKNGLASLTQTLLLKGTRRFTTAQIALLLESMGAGISADAHEDFSEINAISTIQDAEPLLKIFTEILFHPVFPEKEVNQERDLTLDGIRLSEDNKFYYTYKHFRRLLYGEQHPYGRPVEGSLESIPLISRRDILKYYKRFYNHNNCIISVVADMTESDFIALLKKHSPRKRALPFRRKIQHIPVPHHAAIDYKEKSVEQAFLILGYPTCPIRSPHYVPLKVIAGILGEGMSSQLFTRLRDQMGLAYNVGCAMPSRRLNSHFFAWIGTKPENIDRARDEMFRIIERLKSRKVDSSELKRTKNYIIGRFLLDHQKNIRQAWYPAWFEIMGIGASFDEKYPQIVSNITPDKIIKAANRFFTKPVIEILRPEQ